MQVSLSKEDIDIYISKIVFYIDELNVAGYTQSISDMMGYLCATNASSVDIRLNIVKFIDHIADYYLGFGIDKKTIDFLSMTAMKDVLNSNFICSIEKTIQSFCREILKYLMSIHQSPNDRIRAFIDDCFKKFYNDDNFSLVKAAEMCNYSPYHFGRLFKKVFGKSFNQYLTDYRVEKSKELLKQSHLTVEDIAWKVGFSSVSYYCTVFKRIVGISPRQYASDVLEQVEA